jgi:hypothetical protein
VAIGKISQTGRCAIARSTERTPSRRLALAGVAGIERGGGDSVARARARGEERRTRRLAGSGAIEPPGRARPGGLAPTGGPGPDKWARTDRWGQEEFLTKN